jgi:hypothetical protein
MTEQEKRNLIAKLTRQIMRLAHQCNKPGVPTQIFRCAESAYFLATKSDKFLADNREQIKADAEAEDD